MGKVQRFLDDRVHIQVAVGGKATQERYSLLSLGQLVIPLQKRLISRTANGVVWDITRLRLFTIFLEGHGLLVGLPWPEVLVFGDPGPGDVFLGVIHLGSALIISLRLDAFERHGAVTQPP